MKGCCLGNGFKKGWTWSNGNAGINFAGISIWRRHLCGAKSVRRLDLPLLCRKIWCFQYTYQWMKRTSRMLKPRTLAKSCISFQWLALEMISKTHSNKWEPKRKMQRIKISIKSRSSTTTWILEPNWSHKPRTDSRALTKRKSSQLLQLSARSNRKWRINSVRPSRP